jgi:cytochrome P450
MSLDEIGENSNVLIVAGSETTATWLSGTTFWLLKHPAAYQKLVDEVRSSFAKEEDINLTAVSQLKYLLAVLREGSRMYPPVPSGQPRKVPQGGAVVNGEWIAEGVRLIAMSRCKYKALTNLLTDLRIRQTLASLSLGSEFPFTR